MIIIQERQTVEQVRYKLTFSWEHEPNAGFAFDCDEHGKIDLEKMADERPAAFKNYNMCLCGIDERGKKIIAHGLQKDEYTYTESAIGQCECGERVYLDHFTNTCDGCDTDYNMGGQALAPREQWGSETNESLSDILRIR